MPAQRPVVTVSLCALLALACGGPPEAAPDAAGDGTTQAGAAADPGTSSGAAVDDDGRDQDTGGGTTSGGDTSSAPSDESDDDESDSGGPPPGHPDGMDPWLPDLDPSECPMEYPWQDTIEEAELTARTVCERGCDHTTLTDALAAAQPNDEILLAPGDYDECVTVSVSPLVIRGNEGRARFHAPSCDAEAVFRLDGAQIRLSSIEISEFEGTGVQFGSEVDQAIIERTWFEGLNFAVRGSPRELMLRQIKVKHSGWYDVPLQHAAAIISTNPDALIIDRSVFSHYRQGAWLLGVYQVPHMEFNCSVIAKVAGLEQEADHSFH
ncbi:MAG: hypothetical protein AAF721_36245, partial [Myxococcota bacterium]